MLLVLTRQNLPTLDHSRYASGDGVPERLQDQGIAVRCVSMPRWGLFDAQPPPVLEPSD